jgi:3'-phosphoadenosine 5'-phosphosulfate sulfotransferase (PAPS reductase)/FAD synthetase
MTLREMAKGLGPEDYVIFTNTGKEREQTLEFLHQQETVLGVPLIWLEYCRFNRWKQVSFETASRKGEPFEALLFDRRRWKWKPFLYTDVLLADGIAVYPGSLEWLLYYTPEKLYATVEDEYGQIHPDSRWKGPVPAFTIRTDKSDNPNPFGLYLPNQQTRFCTQELKIRVMRDFMRSQGHGHWVNVVGIRADEPRRHANGKQSTDSRFDVVHPLYHAGIRKPDVLAFWRTQPFDLQLEDHEGNCDDCFLKGKGKLLKSIKKNPAEAQWWIDCEQAAGVTFSKRDSYADLRERATTQTALDFWPEEEESLTCACTD